MLEKINDKYHNMPIQAKASIWFLVCSFMQKGISTITTPVFTRLLSTAEYGQYNVFNSWLGIVTIIVSLNLSAGVYAQGLVKYDDDRKVFSSSLQGLSVTLTLIWTIVYALLHKYWNKILSLTTVQMFSMLIMIWATAAFSFWAAEQRVEYKYKALVLVTLLVSVAKPFVGIVFVVLAQDKVTARILGLALVELIGYVGLFVVQMLKGKRFFSAIYWKYALSFNLPLIPHYLSQMVLSSADRIMISNMIGDSEAGIYSLAYSLSSIMILFNTALMQTLSPWMYQKIKVKRIKDIEPIAYTSLISVAVINLLLILFAPEAVAIFAPKEYHEAIFIIPPVAMSVYFMYSYDLFAKFAFYYEKTKLIMTTSVIGAMLNVILNYFFIKVFGYIAAGYTTLVCYVIYILAHYNLMNMVCKEYCDGIKPYVTKKILAITIPFMVVGFTLLMTYNYPIIRYAIMVLAIIIVIIERQELMETVNKFVNIKKNKNI